MKKMLYELWFELYHRGGGGRADDSCAFEHVFVGEIGQTKDRTGKEVKGMHNWINIYMEEKAGHLDYKGYIKPRRRGRGRG